jgi:Cu-processing system permease protein
VLSQLARKELRDGMRNRWIAAGIFVLGGLALALALLGSSPRGLIRASTLDVTVVSLSSLSVYLLPLIGLMLSYDALVGEFERGTMMLMLTYPVKRWQVVLGKFIGHMGILLIAILAGYGGAGLVLVFFAESGVQGWQAYLHMMGTSLLLGGVFIALGYLVSVLVKERATAVGAAIGLWLLFVVLYDLVLLGILLLDEGQHVGQKLFRALMLISPTDTYRLVNLSLFENVRQSAGLAGVAGDANLNAVAMFAVLLLWVILPLAATLLVFQRREL